MTFGGHATFALLVVMNAALVLWNMLAGTHFEWFPAACGGFAAGLWYAKNYQAKKCAKSSSQSGQ